MRGLLFGSGCALSLVALVLAAACSSDETASHTASDSGLPDQTADGPGPDADAAGTDATDTGVSDAADTGADADASPGSDFSCLNVPFPTSVPDPVKITGQVTDNTTPGMVADIEVHSASDDSLIDSMTTAADGQYTLTVPTGGVPTAVYFRITALNHVETYRYFGYPLTGDAKSGQTIWTHNKLLDYAAQAGITPTAGKGVVYMIGRDCSLKKVGAGVVYTTTPSAQKLGYEDGTMCEMPNLLAKESTDCTYAMSFDVDPGMLALDATLGSKGFRAQNIKVVADAMTWVTIQPDRP